MSSNANLRSPDGRSISLPMRLLISKETNAPMCLLSDCKLQSSKAPRTLGHVGVLSAPYPCGR